MKEIKDKDIREKVEKYCAGGLGSKAVDAIYEISDLIYKVELVKDERIQCIYILKNEIDNFSA